MVDDTTAEKAEGFAEAAVTRIARDGSRRRVRAAIQDECALDLYVNGECLARLGCSPAHVDELAVGHLCTEGIISSKDQIAALRLDGSTRIELAVAGAQRTRQLEPVNPVAWSSEAIFRIADEFALDKTAHARTRGAHSAFLCDLEGKTLCMREDVGRHNAFDKAVGWAIMNGVDLSRCLLYTSGRVPSGMAMKAIRARIPILVSKSVATDKGVALSRAYGLTLICEARPQEFDVLNGLACKSERHVDSARPEACMPLATR